MLKIAIYVSDHGFGHATRSVALAAEFNKFGIQCHLVSKRPAYLFKYLNPDLNQLHCRAIDTGVKHGFQLRTDIQATKSALLGLLSRRNEILDVESKFIRENKIDLMISDAPYLVTEVSAYTGVPVFCVTNFDWYFIYHDVFSKDETMKPVLNTIWALYQRIDASFVLPFSHAESCLALPKQTACGLIARKLDKYSDLRKKLGWADNEKLLLVCFGGEGVMELDYEALCLAFPGKVLSKQTGVDAENHFLINAETDFIEYMYNADIILCKPGYSTFAEATQFSKFIIFCPRENYPEEAALLVGLESYPNKLRIDSLNRSQESWKVLFSMLPVIKPLPAEYRNMNSRVCSNILNKYFSDKGAKADLLSVFDLGSNNLNYLLFDLTRGQVLHKAHWTTGLGRNFTGTTLSAYRISKAKAVLKCALEIDSQINSEKIMLATGVSRLAENALEIKKWAEKRYGIGYRLVSPDEEARYVYHAAFAKRSGEEACIAVDIGGASTELIDLNNVRNPRGVSLPIGLLSLLQLVSMDSTPVLNVITKHLEKTPWGRADRIIGIGLTFSYLAAVLFREPHLDPDSLDGRIIGRDALERLLRNLDNGDHINYLPYLLSPGYLPILRLSASFSLILLDRFAASEIVVCSDGVAVGYARWRKYKRKVN